MPGRKDVEIVVALEVVAQAMPNQPNVGMINESRSLSMFQRENRPTFKGKYYPDVVQEWLKEIERIFRVMDCYVAQKRFRVVGEVITWAVFTREFMSKYFLKDVHGKKQIEFLALKQGNSFVTEYAAKFVKLVKFYPHYRAETDEFSKCIKFESGLRSEIKRAIGYQQIHRSAELVNNCRIYEEDNIAHSPH
ncbi:uncharacterized protein LOC131597845 [Vicia villosa]|uniref:uncharacterized protein LOC131597845 n=1 Tax=Vicia villosa TaxID=3911 RepID=UPI00273CD8F9|nr:uncharacterized protein LOC131597845 [Vicia villosa]